MASPFTGERPPRLLNPEEPAPEDAEVWAFEGTLERVIGGSGRFPVSQRVAWPAPVEWEEVRAFGEWMVERLSINGHVLVGLRAWPEGRPEEGRLVG